MPIANEIKCVSKCGFTRTVLSKNRNDWPAVSKFISTGWLLTEPTQRELINLCFHLPLPFEVGLSQL